VVSEALQINQEVCPCLSWYDSMNDLNNSGTKETEDSAKKITWSILRDRSSFLWTFFLILQRDIYQSNRPRNMLDVLMSIKKHYP